MKIKTRFAPSPTGYLHIGGIRTAFYSWLFSNKNNGKFILRIEDSDLKRFKKTTIKHIIDSFNWFKLYWQEGPYFQTKRFSRYNKIIDYLLLKKKAYKCFCNKTRLIILRKNQLIKKKKPSYDGRCYNKNHYNIKFNKKYVIRFRNPKFGITIFKDIIRGNIKFNNKELDDLIIKRLDGSHTYNFCSVIDDYDMGITHVIRGDDHINNTPKQINILKILKAKIPQYAHVSMILGNNKKKLSKRNNAINVMKYRNEGFIPEALLNYLIRLGWSFKNKEIFNLNEMKKLFKLTSINHSSSMFNIKKLLWFNHHYINNLPSKYIAKHLLWHAKKKKININLGPKLELLIDFLGKRYNTLKEIINNCNYFYKNFIKINKLIINKHLKKKLYKPLKIIYKKFIKNKKWTINSINNIINYVIIKFKLTLKEIYMPLRIIITGTDKSPSINNIINIIGKNKCLLRINIILIFIKKNLFI